MRGGTRQRIAIDTDKANEQHYELPAGFFAHVLGPHLKYSCALWAAGDTLADAEERMLALTCARAGIRDGQNILELGCGWGSLTLWIASRYPAASITAVSNSASQREFILARARSRGLANVSVVTADANDFGTESGGIGGMFEHSATSRLLMERISRWLPRRACPSPSSATAASRTRSPPTVATTGWEGTSSPEG